MRKYRVIGWLVPRWVGKGAVGTFKVLTWMSGKKFYLNLSPRELELGDWRDWRRTAELWWGRIEEGAWFSSRIELFHQSIFGSTTNSNTFISSWIDAALEKQLRLFNSGGGFFLSLHPTTEFKVVQSFFLQVRLAPHWVMKSAFATRMCSNSLHDWQLASNFQIIFVKLFYLYIMCQRDWWNTRSITHCNPGQY